jgi:conjugal transfer/type IV secretion protein DotA/TraY
MGSALASNVWSIILQSASNYSATTAAPSAPLVAQQAMDIIEMKACQAAFNARWNCLSQSIPALQANQIPDPTPVHTRIGNVDGTKYSYSSPALSDQDICGSYFIPDAPSDGTEVHDAEVSALQDEIGGDFTVAGQEILQVMPDVAGCGGTAASGVGNITLNPYVTTAIQNYEKAVASAANSNYQSVDAGLIQQASQTVEPLGWVFAGTFLNTIDRIQGDVARVAQSGLPTTTVPDVDGAVAVAHDSALNHIRTLFNSANDPSKDADIRAKVSEDLKNFHVLSKQELATVPQCASMVGLNNDGEKWYKHVGAKTADLVFGMLDYLAQMNGVWSIPDTQKCGTSTASSGLNTFTVGVQIGEADPIAQMAALGHANLNTAFDLLALGVGTKAIGSGAALINGLVGTGLSGVGALFTALSLVFFTCGFVLSYLIPLMPFLRFLFSVVAWIGALIEGVIFVPLMALAHLTPEGEGLTGEAGKTGWYFIFNLFLRPVLTIFGLVAGLLVFYIALAFLNYTYNSLVSGSGATVNGLESLSRLIYSALYVVILYIVSNHAFALIDHTPAHALQWLGKSGQHIQSMGNAERMENAAAVVSTVVARDFLESAGRKSNEMLGNIPNGRNADRHVRRAPVISNKTGPDDSEIV